MRDFNITDARSGAAITVKIVPKASRTEIVGIEEDGTLKIRLMAPPVEGKANEELIAFLAHILGIRPAQIEIIAGHDTREKLISIFDVSTVEVNERIRAHLAGRE
jgi:uncharacterized protein (TIGR00251 family)